ncbi:MAG TPA: hypothetical protein VG125_14230 [Pirellulales bacterium]|jgi:hypothetical protein|nr:hypothetical protein [Pirellulales bacterium]
MASGSTWQQYFQNWPPDVPPRGILVTRSNDQVPFDGFLTSDTMLLLQRKTPDNVGARKVLMAYDEVVAVKFIDVVRGKAFETVGFTGKIKD